MPKDALRPTSGQITFPNLMNASHTMLTDSSQDTQNSESISPHQRAHCLPDFADSSQTRPARFAFEPEPDRPQALDARIRFVAASRVEAAQELQSRTYGESAKTGSRAPKRILIVDDDALVRASLAAVLECEGYEVFGADNGSTALQTAAEHEPDLVLLDLSMPIMDGWTAFGKLERTRPLTPVIVITARPHQYKHAVRLGVDAFMEKPLNFPILLRVIRQLTFEPIERHTRRITNPGFVTRFLGHAKHG